MSGLSELSGPSGRGLPEWHNDRSGAMISISKFLLTVNTHQVVPRSQLLPTAEQSEWLRGSFAQLREHLQGTLGHLLIPSGALMRGDYEGIVGVEVGPKRKMLHAHAVISIAHWHPNGSETKLWLRQRPSINVSLQDFFSQALGVAGVYVNAKLLEDQSRAANYANKGRRRTGADPRNRLVPARRFRRVR